jgi:hypothetical protein
MMGQILQTYSRQAHSTSFPNIWSFGQASCLLVFSFNTGTVLPLRPNIRKFLSQLNWQVVPFGEIIRFEELCSRFSIVFKLVEDKTIAFGCRAIRVDALLTRCARKVFLPHEIHGCHTQLPDPPSGLWSSGKAPTSQNAEPLHAYTDMLPPHPSPHSTTRNAESFLGRPPACMNAPDITAHTLLHCLVCYLLPSSGWQSTPLFRLHASVFSFLRLLRMHVMLGPQQRPMHSRP